MTDQRTRPPGSGSRGPQSTVANHSNLQPNGSTSTCIGCRGEGVFRTPTGHYACLVCLVERNYPNFMTVVRSRILGEPTSVTDVTDVTAERGEL